MLFAMPKKSSFFTSRPSIFIAVLLAAPLPLVFAKPAASPEVPVANLAPSPSEKIVSQESLTATAWVQSAAEAKIAARQAYFLATRQLDAALRSPKWSAAIEQKPRFEKLPPAVILDLDETVLDNSPYQARLVRDNALYSSQGWTRWVAQADASAIPGASAFLEFASKKGVQIFYVSNRNTGEEAATRENLRRLGLPVQGPDDHVLMSGERPEWTSDKTTRRTFVAQKHRILLLVGDDLNDFVTAKPRTRPERLDLMERYAQFWGQRWIMLSNPLYGSWEGALFDYRSDLSREEMLQRKYNALQTGEASPPLSPVPLP